MSTFPIPITFSVMKFLTVIVSFNIKDLIFFYYALHKNYRKKYLRIRLFGYK